MNNVGGHSPPYGVLETKGKIAWQPVGAVPDENLETTWRIVGWAVPTIIVVSFVKKNQRYES